MGTNFRLNVTSANFPLLSSLHGRSIILKSPTDTNYVTVNAYSGGSADRDIGIPSVIYMHNVIPATSGFTSVDYNNASDYSDDTGKIVYKLIKCDGTRYLYLPTENGNYLLMQHKWINIGGFSNPSEVTVAHIRKTTYICHANSFIQKLNESTNKLELVKFNGIDTSKIMGISSVNNFLIAYTKDTIYYSAVLDSEDFVPSLYTLAGSMIPNDIRGAIKLVLPTTDGFMIFTTVNMVRATFMRGGGVPHSDLPFRFNEVLNSGGIKEIHHVSRDNNDDAFYCWTTKGLQTVGKLTGTASHLFSEITDFITSRMYEDYIGDTQKRNSTNESGVWSSETESWANEGYNEIKDYRINEDLKVSVNIIASRYLLISYGLPNDSEFSFVLYHDLVYKRWGKLRIKHKDCFEFDSATTEADVNDVNKLIGFLTKDGKLKSLDASHHKKAHDSILIIGKIARARGIINTLHSIEAENSAVNDLELSVLTSLDGKNYNPAIYPIKQIDTRNLSKWLCRTTGINHMIKFSGTFSFVSVQGMFTDGGSR